MSENDTVGFRMRIGTRDKLKKLAELDRRSMGNYLDMVIDELYAEQKLIKANSK